MKCKITLYVCRSLFEKEEESPGTPHKGMRYIVCDDDSNVVSGAISDVTWQSGCNFYQVRVEVNRLYESGDEERKVKSILKAQGWQGVPKD